MEVSPSWAKIKLAGLPIELQRTCRAAIASFGALVSLHGSEDGGFLAVLVDQELGRAVDVEVRSHGFSTQVCQRRLAM